MINGQLTKLSTFKPAYPLWSANVASTVAPLEYTLVRLDASGKVEKKETEVRQLPEGASRTPNDFFDRPNTLHTLPPLPQVYENKVQQNSPFFREGYIGNLFVEGNPAKIKYIKLEEQNSTQTPLKSKFSTLGNVACHDRVFLFFFFCLLRKRMADLPIGDFRLHSANENIHISSVNFNLSGQSAREYAKLSYQLKFPKTTRLLGLAALKLRNEETDATLMREKLYVDMLNSLGVPAKQAAYARLYFNGRPVGLFVGMDEMKKHWDRRSKDWQVQSRD